MPNFPGRGKRDARVCVCASKAEAFRLLTRRTAIVRKSRMEIRCAGASTMQFRRVGNHPFFTPLPYVPPPVGASFASSLPFSLTPPPSLPSLSFASSIHRFDYRCATRLCSSLARLRSIPHPTHPAPPPPPPPPPSPPILSHSPLVKRVCPSARESVPKTLL